MNDRTPPVCGNVRPPCSSVIARLLEEIGAREEEPITSKITTLASNSPTI